VRRRVEGSCSRGEWRTGVGGVSRFLGVRVAAASAVGGALGRGGGAGLGRASRLNVLNGRHRRRLYTSGPLSISPKTPRSRATGAANARAPENEFLFYHPLHFRPPKALRPRTAGFYVLLLLLLLSSLLSVFLFFTLNASHTHRVASRLSKDFTPSDVCLFFFIIICIIILPNGFDQFYTHDCNILLHECRLVNSTALRVSFVSAV